MKYHGIADEVTVTTRIEMHPNGNITVSEDHSSCRKCLNISISISLLATIIFFIMVHWVFASYNEVQFNDPNEKTLCDQQLFRANFGLVIASYCVGVFVIVLAAVVYKKYFVRNV